MIAPIEMKCFYCGTDLIRMVVVRHAACKGCKRKNALHASRRHREKMMKLRKPKKKKARNKKKIEIEKDPWEKYRPRNLK